MYSLLDYTHNDKLSLVEFIYNFLNEYNLHYDTVDDNGNIVCGKKRHRSLGDIYEICKKYYDTSLEEVKDILLDFGEDLVGHYCSSINKRVYELKKNDYREWRQHSTYRLDEYGEAIAYRYINKHIHLFKT